MPDFLRWLTSDDVYPWVMGMLGLLVLVLFRVWALIRRLRGDVALAVDDPTPDDLMAVADAVREDTWTPAQPGDTPGELVPGEDVQTPPNPVLYQPCGHTWVDQVESIRRGIIVWAPVPCGDGRGHRCTRAPGGHDPHICLCGAEDYAGPVLVVDPPTGRPYIPPIEEDPVAVRLGIVPDPWVTFGDVRVHRRCMEARRDGRYELIVDGCRPHLVGAAAPTGGAA